MSDSYSIFFFNLMTKQSHKYTKEVVMQSSYDIMIGKILNAREKQISTFFKTRPCKKISRSWRFYIKSNTTKPKWKMVLIVVTWALSFTSRTWLSNICSFIYCWPLTWKCMKRATKYSLVDGRDHKIKWSTRLTGLDTISLFQLKATKCWMKLTCGEPHISHYEQ